MNNNNIDDILLKLTGKKDTLEDTEIKTEDKPLVRYVTKADEIEDFVNKKADKPLTETDYLILTEYSKATPENVICEEYNIQTSYLQKLLRNANSLEFLKKYKSNTEMQMMIRGNSVMSKVWEKKLAQIDTLLREGKESLAFREMFGKLSFVEAQEKLTKMNQGEVETEGNKVENLFINLIQRD